MGFILALFVAFVMAFIIGYLQQVYNIGDIEIIKLLLIAIFAQSLFKDE